MAIQEGVFIIALMRKDNHPLQILLQYRKNTGLHDGKYAFPGGKRESNESLVKAAQRELYEETGLIVGQKQLQLLTRCAGKDKKGVAWRCAFFLCILNPISNKAQLKEPNKHKLVSWYSIDSLPKNLVFAVKQAVSYLRAYLEPENNETKQKVRKIVVPEIVNLISDVRRNQRSSIM